MVASDISGEKTADLISTESWINSQTLKKIEKNLSKEIDRILTISSKLKTISTNKTWTKG